MDCKLGQACRAAPAVAPQVPIVATAVVNTTEQPKLLEQTEAPSSILAGLWRPPRAI